MLTGPDWIPTGSDQMLTRRDWLRSAAFAGTAVAAGQGVPRALVGATRGVPTASEVSTAQNIITRTVPSTGEELPIVGLGTSASFRFDAERGRIDVLRDVLQALVENGGTVLDTAPDYSPSEEVSGDLAEELGVTDRIFWATKLDVAGRGGTVSPRAARRQINRSFVHLGVDVIDLIQVHNMYAPAAHIAVLQEVKAEGRVRYIGITNTRRRANRGLAQAMKEHPLDFIGIDYAVDNTAAAEVILPLAAERGIGVLVYSPFGRRRLFRRVADREVPAWAREFGAESWAQFFIKFAAAHPAVTVVTPGTSRADHMLDNMGAARGRLPDADEQARMVEFVDGLPQPPQRG